VNNATDAVVAVVVVDVATAPADERVAAEALRLVDRARGVTAGDLLAGGVLVGGDTAVTTRAAVAVAAAGIGLSPPLSQTSVPAGERTRR
jgi:hypothetical protein